MQTWTSGERRRGPNVGQQRDEPWLGLTVALMASAHGKRVSDCNAQLVKGSRECDRGAHKSSNRYQEKYQALALGPSACAGHCQNRLVERVVKRARNKQTHQLNHWQSEVDQLNGWLIHMNT